MAGVRLGAATVELPPLLGPVAVALVLLIDAGHPAGLHPLWLAGLTDETAHTLTGVVVLCALGRVRVATVLAVLAASVLIDVDHIPQYLGWKGLTEGTPRPYSHSGLTLLLVATVLASARWRPVALGVILALAAHLTRDMGDGSNGVALLWPLSDAAVAYPGLLYYLGLLALALVPLRRRTGAVARRLLPPTPGRRGSP